MAAAPSPARLEWIDILRGVSAFAIVLFHVRVTMWVGAREIITGDGYSVLERALAWLTAPFPFFGSGVMLFFVVSGFVIHYPYAGEQRPLAWRPYAVRRFLRIYPPYAVAILLTLLAEQLAAQLAGAGTSPAHRLWASLTMTQNYVWPPGQLLANPSLWSLPVEVELYVAYPILLWVWRRAGTARVLIGVGLVSAIASALPEFVLPEWRGEHFAKYWIVWVAGAALAEGLRTNGLPRWRTSYAIAGVAGCLAAVVLRAADRGFEHLGWGLGYTILLLWLLDRPSSVLALPPPVRRIGGFLGRVSYSLYLVHFPVLVVTGACWIAIFGQKPVNLIVPLVASLVPLPFAYVLWRFVERPSQLRGRALAAPPPAPFERTVPAPAGS